jgi:hypothetical protein
VWYRSALHLHRIGGALVPGNLHLSLEMVQQIVGETHPNREWSRLEIERLTRALNISLSEHQHRKQLLSEPTPVKLRRQIRALRKELRNALSELKLALSTSEQNSLRNYLIHLGEDYAHDRSGHPNLAPHYASGVLETGEEVSAIDHYRSDEYLDGMISSISHVLEWMRNPPKTTEELLYWWDRTPHWLDCQTVEERLQQRFRPLDHHGLTERLIGGELPHVYHLNFGQPFKVSRGRRAGKYGPGVRFVVSVLKHAGVNVAPNTVIRYRTRWLKRHPK